MKKAVLLILIALLQFNAYSSKISSRTETIIIKTKIYCDHCLECESCGGKLQKDFGFNKGIKLVKVDAKAMTITVKYNPSKITVDEIRKTIAAYGYDADDVKADETAYSKLDGCCKKQD